VTKEREGILFCEVLIKQTIDSSYSNFYELQINSVKSSANIPFGNNKEALFYITVNDLMRKIHLNSCIWAQ